MMFTIPWLGVWNADVVVLPSVLGCDNRGLMTPSRSHFCLDITGRDHGTDANRVRPVNSRWLLHFDFLEEHVFLWVRLARDRTPPSVEEGVSLLSCGAVDRRAENYSFDGQAVPKIIKVV